MLNNNILHIISCSYTTTKSYMVILTHKDVCHQYSFLQQKHPDLTDKTFFNYMNYLQKSGKVYKYTSTQTDIKVFEIGKVLNNNIDFLARTLYKKIYSITY